MCQSSVGLARGRFTWGGVHRPVKVAVYVGGPNVPGARRPARAPRERSKSPSGRRVGSHGYLHDRSAVGSSAGRSAPSAHNVGFDVLEADATLHGAENGRPFAAHALGITSHHAQIRAHSIGEVDLVDDEQIGLRDARAAFPWHLCRSARETRGTSRHRDGTWPVSVARGADVPYRPRRRR